MYVVHVGDSRCYLFRESKLTQITRDHTFGQELVDAGRLQPEEAASSRLGNVLSNVLGGDAEEGRPEVSKNELALGDTILLCSDGLTKHVPDDQIALQLERDLTAEQTCQQLVDKANDWGGSDNITVVVARFRRTDEQADLAAEEVVIGEDTERANARSEAEQGATT
jgi:protein phosphatase